MRRLPIAVRQMRVQNAVQRPFYVCLVHQLIEGLRTHPPHRRYVSPRTDVDIVLMDDVFVDFSLLAAVALVVYVMLYVGQRIILFRLKEITQVWELRLLQYPTMHV